MIVGGLSFIADIFGTFISMPSQQLLIIKITLSCSCFIGSAVPGSSIVVLVTVIFQYYEIVLRESGGLLQNLLGEL